MAVTQNAGGTVVTGESINVLRFLMAMRGIASDMRGLKPTRGFSSIKIAAEYGVTARTKKQALEGMVAVMREVDPQWEPTGTVKRALES